MADRDDNDQGGPRKAPELVWTRIRERMRADVGERVFERCLASLVFVSSDGACVTLGLDDRVLRNWVLSHYLDRLHDLWQSENCGVSLVEVIYIVPHEKAAAAPAALAYDASAVVGRDQAVGHAGMGASGMGALSAAVGMGAMAASSGPSAVGASARESSGLNAEFTFDNFVVGPSNALAAEAARRAAAVTRPHFNPLYIHGPSGLGKTHLLHAIGNAITARSSSLRVRYSSAEGFLFRFVAALRNNNAVDFKQTFRALDVLLIDDVQFIARKEVTQEEFFHTLNALITDGRLVVISADCAPGELEGFHDRVRSRLGGGMTAEIGETDFPLRLRILQSKAERFRAALAAEGRPDLTIEPAALELMAERIAKNGRVLEGMLNKVAAHADFVGEAVTPAFVQSVLRDVFQTKERSITIEEIKQITAKRFGYRTQDLECDRRQQPLVRARHIAMFLCRELTKFSYPVISRHFGGRDHSTVISAVNKIDDRRKVDRALDEELKSLTEELKHRH